VLAAAVYLAAGVLTAIPAIGQARSQFLADGAPDRNEVAAGGHLEASYRLWLAGHQLERGEPPWRDPYSFQPEVTPTVNPAWWPFGILYWGLVRSSDPVLAWNVLLLLGIAVAGGLTCAWLRALGLPRGPALAGGLVFAIAPSRLQQSADDLLGLTSLLLPLALWAFEHALRARRWWWSTAWHLLAGASLASIPLTGQLSLAMGAIPFFTVYAAVRTRAAWHLGGAAAGALAAVAAGLFLRLAVIDGTIAADGWPLTEVRERSAAWLDLVTRDGIAFVGWLTPLVALGGLTVLTRSRRRARALAVLLALGVVVPSILALGTTAPFFGFARDVFSPLRYALDPGRMLPIACLSLAALVAFALEWFERPACARLATPPTRARRLGEVHPMVVVTAVAIGLLLADLRTSPFEASAAGPGNRAYDALGEGSGRVLELPIVEPRDDLGTVYLYYAMQAPRERPLGTTAWAPVEADDVARALRPIDCGDWTTRPGPLLNALGVRAIALHRGLFGRPGVPERAWFAWMGLLQAGFRPVARDEPVTVFRRGGRPDDSPKSPPFPPPSTGLVACSGWGPNDGRGRRMGGAHAAVWVRDSGDARLYLSAPRPTDVLVGVNGRARESLQISELTEVRLTVGAESWHLVTFDASAPGARLVAYALS
jgi:hypothetical protein